MNLRSLCRTGLLLALFTVPQIFLQLLIVYLFNLASMSHQLPLRLSHVLTHLFSQKKSYINLSPFSFLSSSLTSIKIPLCNLKSFFFHSRKPVSSAMPGKGSDCNAQGNLFCLFLTCFFPSAAVLTDLGMTFRESASTLYPYPS